MQLSITHFNTAYAKYRDFPSFYMPPSVQSTHTTVTSQFNRTAAQNNESFLK